jgi:hypothetical protein
MNLLSNFGMIGTLLLSIIATISKPAMASSSSQVIYDYPFSVATIRVEPSNRKTLAELEPVTLHLEGSIETSWRTRPISGAVEGILLADREVEKTRRYLLLLRSENVIYTDKGGQPGEAIGEVDEDGRLIVDPKWSWRVIYREYRYTLADRLLVLVHGVIAKNQEGLFIELDPL